MCMYMHIYVYVHVYIYILLVPIIGGKCVSMYALFLCLLARMYLYV